MLAILLAAVVASVYADIVPVVNMPSGFQGVQYGIGSWYRANNPQDYTNGHSWCNYPYDDSMPLFAPALTIMCSDGCTYTNDEPAWRQAIAAYCGLEAEVTDPDNGNKMLLYIGDSFGSPRTPGSIDIMVQAWAKLYGSTTSDKNIVIKNVTWTLTGSRNTAFAAS